MLKNTFKMFFGIMSILVGLGVIGIGIMAMGGNTVMGIILIIVGIFFISMGWVLQYGSIFRR